MEPEGVRMILWSEGDYFTCRRDGAELLVQKVAVSLMGAGPYYPVCPWCGGSMDIWTLNSAADQSSDRRETV